MLSNWMIENPVHIYDMYIYIFLVDVLIMWLRLGGGWGSLDPFVWVYSFLSQFDVCWSLIYIKCGRTIFEEHSYSLVETWEEWEPCLLFQPFFPSLIYGISSNKGDIWMDGTHLISYI